MNLGIIRRAKMGGKESSSGTFKRLERICLNCKGTSAWRIGVSTNPTGSNQSHSRSGRRAAS